MEIQIVTDGPFYASLTVDGKSWHLTLLDGRWTLSNFHHGDSVSDVLETKIGRTNAKLLDVLPNALKWIFTHSEVKV